MALAGDFECLISDQKGECTPLDNGTVTNRISISCFDNDKNQFITLNHGDKINVKAFIIPNEESIGTRQISRAGRRSDRGRPAETAKKAPRNKFLRHFSKKIFMTDSRRIRHFSLRFDAERQ